MERQASLAKTSNVRDLFWDAFFGIPLGGADVLYRTSSLRAVDGLPEGIELGEDWVGGLRVARQGCYAIIPDRLVHKRSRRDHGWSDEVFLHTLIVFEQEAHRWLRHTVTRGSITFCSAPLASSHERHSGGASLSRRCRSSPACTL